MNDRTEYNREYRRKNLEWIRAYQRKYQRRWRQANPEKAAAIDRRRRLKYPEKIRAVNKVTGAVRRGRLKRQPCEVCGRVPAQAHHTDYGKPYDVKWLCQLHHEEVHHGQATH